MIMYVKELCQHTPCTFALPNRCLCTCGCPCMAQVPVQTPRAYGTATTPSRLTHASAQASCPCFYKYTRTHIVVHVVLRAFCYPHMSLSGPHNADTASTLATVRDRMVHVGRTASSLWADSRLQGVHWCHPAHWPTHSCHSRPRTPPFRTRPTT